MKEQNSEEEVMKILDDIPNSRQALLENYDNLLNVAEYCNNKYIQVLLLQLSSFGHTDMGFISSTGLGLRWLC